MKTNRITLIIGTTLLLLCILFVAMQITEAVNWKTNDFIIAGLLLLSLGFSLEFMARKTKSKKTRIALIILAVLAFVLLWAELAVGLFGSPIAGS